MNKANLSRGILFFVTVVFWFAQYAYTPFVNPQLITMGVTASVMGFIGGAYGFTQFIFRIPVGIAADKWQKKFFICAGCLSAGLAALCMLVFQNPVGFLVGRALGGVAASSWVPFTVLYSSYYKPEHATRAIATINLASQLGRFFSFLVAALVASWFGAQAAFLISTIGGFSGFFMSLLVREKTGDEDSPAGKKPVAFRELLAVGKERTVLVTSMLATFVQIIAFSTHAGFTANHAVYIGASLAQLGYVQLALLLPSILLGFALSKYILQRVDAKPLVVLGFAATVLYCLIVPFTSTILQLYAVQVIGGVGSTLTFSLLMGLCVQNIAAEKRGAAMGFFQSIYGIGMTTGPIIMGFITDYAGLRYGFFFMGGVAGVSTLVSAIFLHRSKTGKAA